MTAHLRARRVEDVAPLLEILQVIHEREGYPVRDEAVSDWWLASSDELSNAVAELDGRPVGHVALHPADEGTWAGVTDTEVDELVVVSRLFTDRSAKGLGGQLLDEAVRQARALGRKPVLQVDPESAARDWYLRRGWQVLGSKRQQWGPRTVDAVLMEPGEAG